jgi:putative zinc finger/helix-turn-helix YgiT family protein
MRCDNCGSNKMKQQKGPYHYTGSGLPAVYLKNVKWSKCEQCNDIQVEISKIAQLHRCIAYYVVLKDTFLTGQEIVFLRKMLRKNQRAMAKDLGISEVSLNRWEKENRGHTKAMDTLFRMVYLSLQDDEYTHEANRKISEATIRFFGNTKKSEPESISVEIDPKTCSVSEIFENAMGSSSCSTNACV